MNAQDKKIIIFGIGGVFALGGIMFGVKTMDTNDLVGRLDNIYQNPNPLIRHFSPTWRSLKKIVDIFYLPRTLFHASSLPAYELTLSKNDFFALLAAIPYEPAQRKPSLTDEYKETVRGRFRAENLDTEAKIRYRGLLANHWTAAKKSWQINLPAGVTLDGMRQIRLILPSDRLWTSEFLEAYRAKKFGVLTPDIAFVTLKVNGENQGVYMRVEGWEQSFLERNGRTLGEIFSDQDIDLTKRIDYLRSDAFLYWHGRINPESRAYDEALARFLSVISDTSDEEFARQIPRILDMEKLYGWALESLLARNYHQKNIVNLNFYFDPARGLFEPIATDMYSAELGDAFRVKHHRLLNRILKHEPFRKQFEALAKAYVDDPRNLEDDLAYYDTNTNSIKKDIMADTAKLSLTSEFLSYYKEHREVIIKNVQKIQAWLRDDGSLPLIFSDETYPLGGETAK